jgi:hypothetical protein
MTAAERANPADKMSEAERACFGMLRENAAVSVLVRTQMRVDTGGWLRNSAMWLCLTDSELVLFAANRRRFLQRLPLIECAGTSYCHVSGALHLQPSDRWHFSTIAMPPVEGIKIEKQLALITKKQISPATECSGA